MNIEFRNLKGVTFDQLNETFHEAFSDYAIDVSYMTTKIMKNRAIKNGYDPGASVGVYENDKLVGFTLTGISEFKGTVAGFDIMTGLIKSFRGKGIASQMFNYIRTTTKNKGARNFYLEVLQENKSAIKAYERSGFVSTRAFDCYELQIENFKITEPLRLPLEFKTIGKNDIDRYETYSDWPPSWENSFNSITRIPDEVILIEARYSLHKVGMYVYYPAIQWILALIVNPDYRKMGVGSALLNHLMVNVSKNIQKIHMINIQSDDEPLIRFLKDSGFEVYTKQYEMKCEL